MPFPAYSLSKGCSPGHALAVLAGSGVAPVAPLLHTFSGADDPSSVGTADSGHVPNVLAATWGRIGGEAYMSSGSPNGAVVFDVLVSDGLLEVTFVTISQLSARLIARATDFDNYVYFQAGSGALVRRQAAALTTIGSTAAFSNGDVCAIALSGSSVIVRRNGVDVITVTEAFNQTATLHGIGNGNAGATNNRFDLLKFTP